MEGVYNMQKSILDQLQRLCHFIVPAAMWLKFDIQIFMRRKGYAHVAGSDMFW